MRVRILCVIAQLFAFYYVSSPITLSAEEITIVSPHWEGMKREFSEAFKKYTSGQSMIRWLDVGGTSDILRFLKSQSKVTPTVDVVFGGGTAPFVALKELDLLESITLPPAINEQIAESISGTPIHDPDHTWHSAMLASFGILCNLRVLGWLGINAPVKWADLADPRLKGWVGLADPRKSGTAHMIVELILQAHGWDAGWSMLNDIVRNTSSFTSGSSELPWLISSGELACGAVIDSYAAFAADYAGEGLLTFTIPQGESPLLGDGIALLKNAPHRQSAEEFIQFVLSEAGQKLLLAKRGTPGGPEKFELRKHSVVPALYAKLGNDAALSSNPYLWQMVMKYDGAVTEKRWTQINDLVGIFSVEAPPRWIAQSRGAPISEDEFGKLVGVKSWVGSLERHQALEEWRRKAWNEYQE